MPGMYNHVKVDLVDLRWGVRSAEMGSGQVENCIQQVLAADLFIGKILSFSLNILVSVFFCVCLYSKGHFLWSLT